MRMNEERHAKCVWVALVSTRITKTTEDDIIKNESGRYAEETLTGNKQEISGRR